MILQPSGERSLVQMSTVALPGFRPRNAAPRNLKRAGPRPPRPLVGERHRHSLVWRRWPRSFLYTPRDSQRVGRRGLLAPMLCAALIRGADYADSLANVAPWPPRRHSSPVDFAAASEAARRRGAGAAVNTPGSASSLLLARGIVNTPERLWLPEIISNMAPARLVLALEFAGRPDPR